jgi:uncharacterized caspase-like protein
MRSTFAALLLLATALSPLPTLAAEPLRGVALVIGESDYSMLPDLANPERDARALDNLLGDLGFDVSRVLDGDADELREEIAEFVEDAADADVALVYYSGHGVELGGQNYLVPTNTDLSTPEVAGRSLVAVDEMLAELARTVPVTILLLDACRTDVFPAGQLFALPGMAEPLPVEGPGLEAVKGPTPVGRPGTPAESLGVVIGFAASPGQPALDGEAGGNSPYAAALVKHFSAGGYSLADLMTMVGEEVYLETQARQLPWVNSSLRRVLTFGAPIEAAEGDDAKIREGRRQLLMTIASAPEATRRFVENVAQSENVSLDALYGMLKVLGVDTADADALGTQLKAGAERLKALMDSRTGATLTDAELVRLAGLADKAEAEGAIDVALGFREQASARADDLELAVDANQANLEADRLQIGATYADHAMTAELNFDFARSIEMWRKAIGQVEDWDETLAAGYRNNLGVALMGQGGLETGAEGLIEAATVLEASLASFDRTGDPLNWARAQSNLGNVLHQLGDRERDPRRYYEAADAHRAALGILTRAEHPRDWATAEMNLGNALARIGENEEGTESLEAAIEAFRLALEVRTRETAPLDWSAANDNLGSALSSLAGRTGDAELLAEGIAAFRNTLAVRVNASSPLGWAYTQRNLGLALKTYGVMSGDLSALHEGADAYRAALEVFTPERAPQDFAQTSAILGFALMEIAKAEPSRPVLEEARERFADANSVFGPLSPDDDAYFRGRIAEIDAMLGG